MKKTTFTQCLLFMALLTGAGNLAAQTLCSPASHCQAHFTWQQSAPNVIAFSDTSSTGTNTSTTYHWTFGDGNRMNGQNPAHTYNIPGTYTVCLKISDTAGCRCTFCDTIHVTGTVICSFSIKTQAEPSSCNLCADGEAEVTQLTGGSPPYTYSWNPGGSMGSQMGHLLPGIYTVCVTDKNGCRACASDTVKIKTGPCQAHFTWVQTAPNTIAFYDSSSTGTGVHTTYSWNFGGGTQGNGQNPVHVFNVPGTHTVCLTIHDRKGCESTFCDTIHVTGTLICTLAFGTETEPASCNLCGDGEAEVEKNTGGTPPYAYSWSPGGATTNEIEHLNPGIYTVCVTDANGCKVCRTDTITLKPNISSCQAHFTWTQTAPNHITFDNSSSVNTGPHTSYLWSFGNGNVAAGANPSAVYNVPGTYTVCLSIRDTGHCHSTFCDTIQVTGPVICNLIVTARSYHASCDTCHDGSAALAHLIGGTAPFTYSWSTGDTTQSSRNLMPGTYTLCVTDANACKACTLVTVGKKGHPACSAEFILQADTLHPGNYIVTNLSKGSGPLHYVWSWGDGSANDTIAAPHHTYPSAGLYQICLSIKDTTGCSASDCDVVMAARLPSWTAGQHTTVNVILPATATGIVAQDLVNGWNVFPNPSQGSALITYSLSRPSDVNIDVYTLTGQQVLKLQSINNQTAGSHEVPLESGKLKAGMYLIQMRSGSQTVTKRLTIIN